MNLQIPIMCTAVFSMFAVSSVSASNSAWQHVASTQAHGASQLAAEQVRLDAQFYEKVEKFVRSCELIMTVPNEERGLGRTDWHHLYLYSRDICRPWLKRVHQEASPCEPENAPVWCVDHDKGRQRFEPLLSAYFGTLATSMNSMPDPVARYNVIALVVPTMDSAFTREFTAEEVGHWVAPLVIEFLATASGDDALEVASSLTDSWFGLSEESRQAFKRFATESAAVSPSQKSKLLEITVGHEHD